MAVTSASRRVALSQYLQSLQPNQSGNTVKSYPVTTLPILECVSGAEVAGLSSPSPTWLLRKNSLDGSRSIALI